LSSRRERNPRLHIEITGLILLVGIELFLKVTNQV
ncbi:hypothetical protein CARUB_v100123170mg, partial [Capsella rubella]